MFTPEVKAETIEKVLENLRTGMPEYAACDRAAVSFVTWWRWRQEIPGLTERAAEAKRARVPLIEDALYKAALKGSTRACLAILEKEDEGWRNRAKDLAPQQNNFVFLGGAAALIAMLPNEKKMKFLSSMIQSGLLPETVKTIDAPPKMNSG